jgi:phage/plasmid-associated DNA primase
MSDNSKYFATKKPLDAEPLCGTEPKTKKAKLESQFGPDSKTPLCSYSDFANVMYDMYKDTIKCVNVTNKIWYEYDNKLHKWVLTSTEETAFFVLFKQIYGLHETLTDSEKIPIILESLYEHNDPKFLENIINEMSYKLYDDKFMEKLDTLTHLVGFNNGVYDLSSKHFRQGCPTDMISEQIPYDYVEYFDEHPDVISVRHFFEQIMPDEHKRHILLNSIARSLGKNTHEYQKLTCWVGSGSNGKSKLMELVAETFGPNYFGALPMSALKVESGKSTYNSFSFPELADKKGKRFLKVEEPEFSDVINVGRLKQLVDTDKIYTRTSSGEPFSYTPNFSPVLMCSRLPELSFSSMSDDMTSSLNVINFGSKFVDNPNSENPNEFKIIHDLNVSKLKQAFMWMLINGHY